MKTKRIDLDFGFWIDTWYDRKTRSWVCQLKDFKNNQVGNAEYVGTKAGISTAQEILRTRAKTMQPRDVNPSGRAPFGWFI